MTEERAPPAGDRQPVCGPMELARIQQVLDALASCPPQGWVDGALRWGLRRLYRMRQQRAQSAWERSLARGESAAFARYDFEPDMVLTPGGQFVMGSDPQTDRRALRGEQPQHTLYLPDYYLSRTPVTNAQYAVFVQATGREPPGHWDGGRPPRGKEQHPAVRVSWYDAVAYCNWLSRVTGRRYRLPTEAEWEKAARGSDARIYPWGDQWDAKRCNTEESGRGDTTPVNAHPQGVTAYGLLDMTGNVWEWTSSLYWGYPYRADDGREDPGPADPRVLRGGSWLNSYDSARAAYRRSYIPAYHSRIHGFRCCMSPPPSL